MRKIRNTGQETIRRATSTKLCDGRTCDYAKANGGHSPGEVSYSNASEDTFIFENEADMLFLNTCTHTLKNRK